MNVSVSAVPALHPTTLMAATCSGRTRPCGCQQFAPQSENPEKCNGCKHRKHLHPPVSVDIVPKVEPQRTVDMVLSQYGLDRLKPKTSLSSASQEMLAGYKSTSSKAGSSQAKGANGGKFEVCHSGHSFRSMS